MTDSAEFYAQDAITPPQGTDADGAIGGVSTEAHRLRILEVDLIGGGRTVRLAPGLNLVRGDITTGKTTFVRLLRALLGVVPDHMPPEVDAITALRGDMLLGQQRWRVYRPLVTTRDAPIELAEDRGADREGTTVRVPATGRASYSMFMLDRLGIPAVSVPKASTESGDAADPSAGQSPITMTDWLSYCIIPGDELDSQIFGHLNHWRNQKRKWVFELTYGYFDVETAQLTARLRRVQLRLEALDRESEIIEKFLADTPFASDEALTALATQREAELANVRARQAAQALDAVAVADVGELRTDSLVLRARRDQIASEITKLRGQLGDLRDLYRQLQAQSARLTRAIVADEWLVDFEFVVCPRCGNDLDPQRTATADQCYVCLQPEHTTTNRNTLLAEQDRLTGQIKETDEVIRLRSESLDQLIVEQVTVDESLTTAARDLDARTASYVSEHTAQIRAIAAEEARLQADLARANEYRQLLARLDTRRVSRAELERQQTELEQAIQARSLAHSDAEEHVRALERRMLDYLTELHVPQWSDLLTVTINRTTWMPIISGRSFDELSSQGLKTLVNIAHALAHHTVAIDRNLPMPGLLVLDGLSANTGHEGFDLARIGDVYRLLVSIAGDYGGRLQLIAVDNDIPADVLALRNVRLALTLSQDDRLVRAPSRGPGAQVPTEDGGRS